jgi:hypothetical protein
MPLTRELRSRMTQEALPPSHYVAEAIRALPRAGPDVPRQVVDIHAMPMAVWPHEGRYRLTFVVRSDSISGTLGWYWGVESIERLEPQTQDLQISSVRR